MVTFKKLITNAYNEISSENLQSKLKIRFHTIEIYNNNLWLVNDYFALRNDPKTFEFLEKNFKSKKKLLEEKRNYKLTHMNLHPFKNNPLEYKNVYSGVKIEHASESRTELLLQRRDLEPIVSMHTNLGGLVTFSEKSCETYIPSQLHNYILENLNPSTLEQRTNIYYLNKQEDVVALISPYKLFR